MLKQHVGVDHLLLFNMLELIYLLACTHVTIISVTLFLHRSQAHKTIEFNSILSHFMRFWLWLTTGMVTKQWMAVHRAHVGLKVTKRETDEIVSLCMLYMKQGGFTSVECTGLDSTAGPLEEMYRDDDFNSNLQNTKEGIQFINNMNAVLNMVDRVVRCGKIGSKQNWKKGNIKKLFCLIFEIGAIN